MRSIPVLLAVVALTLGQGGCGASVYEEWDLALTHMSSGVDEFQGRFYTVDDVSLLLGSPPVDCKTIEVRAGRVWSGIACESRRGDQVEPRIVSVEPNSPAQAAGLRSGDLIVAVGGVPVATLADALRVFRTECAVGKPLMIVTDRGASELVPEQLEQQQCYWNIDDGRVDRASGSVGWSQLRGGGYYGASSYQTYYRVSCRFENGRLDTCSSNWQE